MLCVQSSRLYKALMDGGHNAAVFAEGQSLFHEYSGSSVERGVVEAA